MSPGLRPRNPPSIAPGVTAAQTIAGALDGVDDTERPGRIAQALGRGGFADGEADVDALSGGWKKRLAIAREQAIDPDILLLDEPTNHLDVATKEMLIDALKDFDGTMLFVSHDRAFLRGLSNRVLELGGETGDAQPHIYPGSYPEYVVRTGHEAPGIRN